MASADTSLTPTEGQTFPLKGTYLYFADYGMSPPIKQTMQSFAARLGATILDKVEATTTHFITNTTSRTPEALAAIAAGAEIVRHQWVTLCWQNDCLTDPTRFRVVIDSEDDDPEEMVTPSYSRHIRRTAERQLQAINADEDVMTSAEEDFDQMKVSLDEEFSAATSAQTTPTPQQRPRAGAMSLTSPQSAKRRHPTADCDYNLDRKRKQNTVELYTCELHTSETMNVLLDVFYDQMEVHVPRGLLNRIFRGVKRIKEVSEKVACDLKDKLDNWEEGVTIISHVFHSERMTELQRAYTAVVAQTDESRKALADVCTQNKAVAQLVRDCEQDPRCKRQRLVDLLQTPASHIMRYNLHLQQLWKHTDPRSPDRDELQNIMKQFHDMVSSTNETKRTAEDLTNLFHFMGTIEGIPIDMISSTRKQLLSMETAHHSVHGSVNLLLFSDCIAVVKDTFSGKSQWRHTLTFGRKGGKKPYRFLNMYLLREFSVFRAVHAQNMLQIRQVETGHDTLFQFDSEHKMAQFLLTTRQAMKDEKIELHPEMVAEEMGGEEYSQLEVALRKEHESRSRATVAFGEELGIPAVDPSDRSMTRRNSVLHSLSRATKYVAHKVRSRRKRVLQDSNV
eukprot:m.31180 g.31180  ORF g.31180 m.31180 type:complete len:621 (+) comp9379_c0_seq1:347-2209(+)